MEDGHDELVEYIDDISTHAVNERFDLVDQVYHAAIPLCQSLEDKWLEVYFRHWRLQAHVLKNYNAKGLLPEAISLLDFAHGEDTKDCPQRICAVQDLAACYGIKDGPGFAEERVSVCQETLAQIDGSWPCFECVSGELIAAQIDAKKYDEAQATLKSTDDEISKFRAQDVSDITILRTRLLIELGEFDKAWERIKDAENPLGGDSFKRECLFLRTLVLCHLERWTEARELMPSFDVTLLAAKYFDYWTKIQMRFLGQGLIENNRELRYRFHLLAEKLSSRQAQRLAFQVYSRLIDLCLSSGDGVRAGLALEKMRVISGEFNRDLGAADKIAELEERMEKMKPPQGPEKFETVEALLDHDFEIETAEFGAVKSGLKQWPGDVALIARQSDLLEGCFQTDEAFTLLAGAYAEHRGSSGLETRYGAAYLGKFGFEKYRSEFPMDNLDGLSNGAIWNRGFIYVRHYENSEPDEALKYLKIIETYWPEDIWLLGRIARLQIQRQAYEEVIAYRRKQIEIEPDNANHKWDLLIGATLAKDIALICEMAEQLEMNIDENGRYPADLHSAVRLQWNMPNGVLENRRALRIGPALARITFVSALEDGEQIYGREVVFDPAPMNRLDHEDGEGHACDADGYYTLLYPPPLGTLFDPEFKTYAVDGLHPGDDRLEELFGEARKADLFCQRRSNEQYKLYWTDGENDRHDSAVYIYFIIEDGQESRVNELLLAFNKTLKHPLVWPQLAEKLGDKTLLLAQAETTEKYGIY